APVNLSPAQSRQISLQRRDVLRHNEVARVPADDFFRRPAEHPRSAQVHLEKKSLIVGDENPVLSLLHQAAITFGLIGSGAGGGLIPLPPVAQLQQADQLALRQVAVVQSHDRLIEHPAPEDKMNWLAVLAGVIHDPTSLRHGTLPLEPRDGFRRLAFVEQTGNIVLECSHVVTESCGAPDGETNVEMDPAGGTGCPHHFVGAEQYDNLCRFADQWLVGWEL